MKIIAVVMLIFLLGNGCLAASVPGLVAHWDFSEGSGSVLHDSSGNGSDGSIKDAAWVKNGSGWALRFDGIDDCVDCGDTQPLDLRGAFTIATWIKPEPPLKPGEAGIAGKAFSSYVLTFFGSIYSYTTGEGATAYGAYVEAPPILGMWDHLVSTYDGKTLTFYQNGLRIQAKTINAKVAKGGRFWIGRSDGDIKYTKDAHFHGQMADLRIYNRALSGLEVAKLARNTNRSSGLDIAVTPIPARRQIMVEVSKSRMLEDDRVISVKIKLSRHDGKQKILLSKKVGGFDADGRLVAHLPIGDLSQGDYDVTAAALDSSGYKIGDIVTQQVTWPKVEKFPSGPTGNKRLNNLVTELLNVKTSGNGKAYSFVNPRDGWIYIASSDSKQADLHPAEGQEQKIDLSMQYGGRNEAMRELPAGRYTISIPHPGKLIVRAIPELAYCMYGSNPKIKELGPFKGQFEQDNVFKHINLLATYGLSENDPFGLQWQGMGRKWIGQCFVPQAKAGGTLIGPGVGDAPAGSEREAISPDDVSNYIEKTIGFTDSRFCGSIGDEYQSSEPFCSAHAGAARKLKAEGESRDKLYYIWANKLYDGPEGRDLVAALVETGGKVAMKSYMREQPYEAGAWQYLDREMSEPIRQYRSLCPGSIPHILVCLGYFSAPPETLDTFPNINYNTYLDMQFNLVAADPDYKGVGGIMTYLADYSDEEVVRLGAKLMRHYCIEGRTDPLVKDPYNLTHIINGDFQEEERGWTLAPAEDGSITFDVSPRFGWLEGRFPPTSEGDMVIVTRRSEAKPNVFSQEVKNLTPGRLYTLEFYSGDFANMSSQETNAVSARIDGAVLLPEKSFTDVFGNIHDTDQYSSNHRAWINYHRLMFKATGSKAKLVVSDWLNDTNPGGTVGQKLMFNFFQIQPYITN